MDNAMHDNLNHQLAAVQPERTMGNKWHCVVAWKDITYLITAPVKVGSSKVHCKPCANASICTVAEIELKLAQFCVYRDDLRQNDTV